MERDNQARNEPLDEALVRQARSWYARRRPGENPARFLSALRVVLREVAEGLRTTRCRRCDREMCEAEKVTCCCLYRRVPSEEEPWRLNGEWESCRECYEDQLAEQELWEIEELRAANEDRPLPECRFTEWI